MSRQFTKIATIPTANQQQKSSQGTNFTNIMMPLMGLSLFLYQYNEKKNECHKSSISYKNKGNEDNKVRFYGTP